MVDVSIDALIKVARDYVDKANVDTDESGSINTGRELNRLLAGTGATSIEELTLDNIRQKMVECDTEKVFTTFMTTENKEQAQRNIKVLEYSIKKIHETYDNLLKGFVCISDFMNVLAKQLTMFEDIFNEGNFGQGAVDKVVDRLNAFRKTNLMIIDQLFEINQEYKKTTGQDFEPILQKSEHLQIADILIREQIDKIQNGVVPIEQAKDEILKGYHQCCDALDDTYQLMEQYENQKKKDKSLLAELLEHQKVFLDDDSDNAGEQVWSKEMLQAFVENASPMTRNFVIQQAEMEYNPENDPTTTGINQISAASKIKRSSYKTPTEIYNLNGNNVIVYDYSGRVLRTETLDPQVHTKFYE